MKHVSTNTHTHTETVISGLVYFFFDNIQAINSVTWLSLGMYMWITCCEGILGSYDGLCFSSFFFFFATIKICKRTGQELRLQLSKNPENNLNS